MQPLREKVQRSPAMIRPCCWSGSRQRPQCVCAVLHALSHRADAPVVHLVAASLTDSNAEELLLGSEKDGNVNNGYLERARNGTLIIDELGDLCDQAQKLLISVLEQGYFIRRRGHEQVRFQARVVATVGEDYERLIDSGKLRRELVSHVNVLMAKVPPLREYAEDVPELLNYYVDKLVDAEGLQFRRFGIAAQNRLRNYPWPDNIRELKNLVRRLMLTGSGEEIKLDEVEAEIGRASVTSEPLVKQDLLSLPLREAREQFERAYLQQQLLLCDGKVGKLAKRVGMERTHLYRKLRSLGVDFRALASDD
jgi:DNA-binding NtrC family response regulator